VKAEEKGGPWRRDKSMSDNEKNKDKLFSDPRWNQPLEGRVVDHRPLTPEEEKEAHEETLAILKSMGIEVKEKEEEAKR
jgi:trimethylamine:corrinoid methyltransferase-like protein